MEYAINSREFESDYKWSSELASSSIVDLARSKFAPAFEGMHSSGRCAVLMRSSQLNGDVMLYVTVSTGRKDFRNRPISTSALLRAENDDEARLLGAFFSECLNKSDEDMLYNSESKLSKAVESIYQTKHADEFLKLCKSLNIQDGVDILDKERIAFPRYNMIEREVLSKFMLAIMKRPTSFLFALVDREPKAVLKSLDSIFDKAVVRIFSKAINEVQELDVFQPAISEGASQKYFTAAAIGGVLVFALAIVAVLGSSRGCSGGCRSECRGNSVGTTKAVVKDSVNIKKSQKLGESTATEFAHSKSKVRIDSENVKAGDTNIVLRSIK